MKTYCVVRRFRNGGSRVIEGMTDLTLEQAREHCKSPESSSTTCSDDADLGDWFDSYEEEDI